MQISDVNMRLSVNAFTETTEDPGKLQSMESQKLDMTELLNLYLLVYYYFLI